MNVETLRFLFLEDLIHQKLAVFLEHRSFPLSAGGFMRREQLEYPATSMQEEGFFPREEHLERGKLEPTPSRSG
jgi:hypothetical protein